MSTVDVWHVDTREVDTGELPGGADRARFAARVALRRIVTRRLGGREGCWVRGPNGKPALDGERLQFNLSHAGDLALIAVTDDRPVGVDLQDLVPGLDFAAMARRFFPPAEADLVARRGAGEFARLWARKEAVVKAAGDRLTRGLSLPVAGDPPPPVEHDGVVYAVADLAAPDGFRAAVALAGPAPFVIRTS
ncbi:4'-phosphopantetheinyl transferase superfamily protein [Dactylosporangium sp. NPDC051484]|uniref:4'-phosphopantetheinyl transferase family protein n=1 Tax=Dactylosporangium sp. NPDC051484 TaxID=3154942 RepID=UPI00344D43D3